MKLVILESPYAGDRRRNVQYARACMHDMLMRGEAPFASHLLYTQDGVLRDEVPEERELGMNAGFEWRNQADYTVFYEDMGWSTGMQAALEHCNLKDLPYTRRTLEHWPKELDARTSAFKRLYLTWKAGGSEVLVMDLFKELEGHL